MALAVCSEAGCAGAQPVVAPMEQLSASELFERGLAYESGGDTLRAEQYMAAAVREGYPPQRAIDGLLRVCVGASRYAAALSHLETYLAGAPDDRQLRYVAATLYTAVGRDEDAASALEAVLRSAPREPAPIYALARLRAQRGDLDGARALFERYLSIAPDGPFAHDAREALGRLGRGADV